MRSSKLIRTAKAGSVILSLLLCGLGLTLMLRPSLSAAAIGIIVGCVLIAFGIVKLIGYYSKDLYRLAFQFDLAFGLLLLALGLVVLLRPGLAMSTLCVILGVEIIADGGHIHPRIVDLASRAKPQDKLIGVSNGIAANGQLRKEENGLVIRNGVIAGTTTTLETGWLHFARYSKMPETLTAACFTSNPAHDLGLITRGEIRPGKKADITFLDLKTNQVRMTVIRGEIVYEAEKKA